MITCKHNLSPKGCQACYRNERRRDNIKFFLTDLWSKLSARCKSRTSETNLKYYYGKTFCAKSEFVNKFMDDPNFLKLHKDWLDSGCVYKLTPSIDRIDPAGNYDVDNIQMISHSENAGKDKDKLAVLMYDLEGNFIREWESKWDAHKTLGIPNGNIVKACYGERKSAGGYIWKFKL